MKVRDGGAASFAVDSRRVRPDRAPSRAERQEIPPANDNQMCCVDLNVHQQARTQRSRLVLTRLSAFPVVGVFFWLFPSLPSR